MVIRQLDTDSKRMDKETEVAGPTCLRLRALVKGRVQGVGYRQFVVGAAQQLGLYGWVRNDPNDHHRVELEAEGPQPQLEKLLEKLKTGPFGARVSEVATQWSATVATFDRFEIR